MRSKSDPSGVRFQRAVDSLCAGSGRGTHRARLHENDCHEPVAVRCPSFTLVGCQRDGVRRFDVCPCAVPGDSLRLCVRTCLTLFTTFWTRVIGWESGVLAAWVGLEDGDLQVWFSGVGRQFNVVEQHP